MYGARAIKYLQLRQRIAVSVGISRLRFFKQQEKLR
jgi:hypothetical protein